MQDLLLTGFLLTGILSGFLSSATPLFTRHFVASKKHNQGQRAENTRTSMALDCVR